MLKRQISHDRLEEVVEDSEPEREEARKRRKEERRKRTVQRKVDSLKIIELTDSDSHGSASLPDLELANYTVGQNRTSERSGPAIPNTMSSPTLSSESNSAISDIGFARVSADTSWVDSVNATSSIGAPEIVPRSQPSQSIILMDTEGEASGTDVEERTDKMRAKLGRYAFSTTSQASSIAGRSLRALPTVVCAIDVVEAPKDVRTRKKKSIDPVASYLDFSEHQLKSILKCVSCDLKWTTRKTVGHKVAHMRACAKKTRLTEETMKVLISREAKVDTQRAEKALAIQAQEPPPKSFLQHVINDGLVHRVGKRQKKVLGTVRGVAETRNDILDRAKLFLNQPSSSRLTLDDHIIMHPPMATQAFGQSNLGSRTTPHLNTAAEPPKTQTFSESDLAVALAGPWSVSQALELMADQPSFDAPPATQVFGASKLSSSTRAGPSLLGTDTSDTFLCTAHLLGPSYNPAENMEASCILNDEAVYGFEDGGGAFDDAVRTFNPKERTGNVCNDDSAKVKSRASNTVEGRLGVAIPFIYKASKQRPRTKPSGKVYLEVNYDGNDPSNVDEKDREKPRMMNPKRTNNKETTTSANHLGRLIVKTTHTNSPRKQKTKQADDENSVGEQRKKVISDEELFDKLKSMVLTDEKLYLRVLRYEPIHLDVFLDMVEKQVEEHNLRGLKLRGKLRGFLDKQAIHYYGSGLRGSRTRR